jgi:6-phosphogluconolactonase
MQPSKGHSWSIFLHIVGEKKLATLNKAMTVGSPYIMPIAAFLNQSVVDLQVMFSL